MSALATVSTARLERASVVRVVGEVDCSNAVDVFADLGGALEPRDEVLVVDLSECSYLDSAGIREILLLDRHLGERRRRLVLVLDPEGPVHRVLTIVGALDAVGWHRSVEDAVRAAG